MPADEDRAELAARALAEAKAQAQARGGLRGVAPPGQHGGGLRGVVPLDQHRGRDSRPGGPATDFFSKSDPSTSSSAGLSQPAVRARRDDPAPLDAAIDGLITESGWGFAVATGSLFGRWAQIVGPDLAAHTTPERLADGELVVTADSTAWATQLRLLASQLIRRLNVELGDNTVRRVQVRGPGAGTRRPGQWRVKGSRGDRDTYG